MIDRNLIEYTASSLYAGGWRTHDKNWLMEEYRITEEIADAICIKLAEYEERSK